MATQEKTWNVANRLHSLKDSDNPEVNHIIAGADEIYDDEKGAKQSDINAQTDAALTDRYTKDETYSQQELNSLITTPDVSHVSVVATSFTTAVTDVLPATGTADTIYRIGNWDGTQYDPTVYSLYVWNGTAYVCLAVRSLVGEVYDISVNHPDGQGNPTPYADLAAALGSDGENIPADIRRGGMSIKFIQGNAQSSDNKYVQWRLMANTFSTTVTDWQGIDEVPIVGSNNLIKSGGVSQLQQDINSLQEKGTIDIGHYVDGTTHNYLISSNWNAVWVKILGTGNIKFSGAVATRVFFFNTFSPSSDSFISTQTSVSNVEIPTGAVIAIYNLFINENPQGFDNIKISQDYCVAYKKSVSDLESSVESIDNILDIKTQPIAVQCSIYKDGYYIGNGYGVPLGSEQQSTTNPIRAIATSTGWQQGDSIIVNKIKTAGVSSCAVATYKNGTFIANLISGNGKYLPDVPYTFTPNYDFDEVRFSIFTADSLSELEVYKPESLKYSKRLDDIETKIQNLDSIKEFKFLLIGSSFGVNTIIQFPFIAMAGGIDVICGNLYKGGGTLQDIVDIINGNKTFDTGRIYNYSEQNAWQATSVDLDTMLAYTDWDVICIQRAASERGTWDSTKAANLQTIIEYLQDKTKGYNPKIVFNSIFAYPVFSTDKTSQLQDTANIITTCQQIQNEFGLEIIPTAVAVQNARMTKMIAHGSVAETIPDMAEDSMHLDTGVGSYVCGALLYEYLIGRKYDKSILTNGYIPSLSDVVSMGIFSSSAYTQPTSEDIIIAKYAAMMACRNQTEVNNQIGTRFPYTE